MFLAKRKLRMLHRKLKSFRKLSYYLKFPHLTICKIGKNCLISYINKNESPMYVRALLQRLQQIDNSFFVFIIVKTALIKENLVKTSISIQKKICGTKFEGRV